MSVTFNPVCDAKLVNKDDKPSIGRRIGGYSAGGAIASAGMFAPLCTTNVALMKKMQDTVRVTSGRSEFNNIVDSAMELSGLNKAGVKLIDATPFNAQEVRNMLRNEYGIFNKIYPKKYIDLLVNNTAGQIFHGANGVFAKKTNSIISGPDKSLLIFHEMGHAMNRNLGKFTRTLGNMRVAGLLGTVCLMTALIKDKKQDGKKPEGFFDKTTTFIKNNVGKLMFMSFVPLLAEEGLASIRGQKIAKQLLSPELYKKVVKGNALGFSSYLLMSIGAGLGAFAANKVRDKIVHKNQK